MRSLAVSLLAVLLARCAGPSVDNTVRVAADPCAVALAAPAGTNPQDRRMAALQGLAARSEDAIPHLERLGWELVSRARVEHDPGFTTLALAVGECIEQRRPGSPEGLLLRGHVLASRHRFREAEGLARELVARRGMWFDHALLGDAVLDQGRLDEALAAYAAMMAERPGPQAYSRAAHVRWLTGDLDGAIEALGLAARASDARDPETAAWFRSRLAAYLAQAGRATESEHWIDAALGLVPDYPPALHVRGLARLAAGRTDEAVLALERAVAVDPLPEYAWALAEALREAGRDARAAEVEDALVARGSTEDPRTVALYLASSGRDIERALALAQAELESRQDPLTLDALALALAAAGRTAEARETSRLALAWNTCSPRLWLHAARIARAAGDEGEARRLAAEARREAHTLLPSERRWLEELIAASADPRVARRT